jgi:hypothetical protein
LEQSSCQQTPFRGPKTGKSFSALPACSFVIACLPVCLLAYSLSVFHVHPSPSLHCLALHFRNSVLSLSLLFGLRFSGGGREASGWPGTEQLVVFRRVSL